LSDLLISLDENRRGIAFFVFAMLFIPASPGAVFAQGSGPTVATPASATPNPVTGVTTSLSVLGSDGGGEAGLTYTWSATGPATVSFSGNGSNAAKNTTATFQASGSYLFQVVIKDAGGSTATSSVTVQVNQTSSTVGIAPPGAAVNINGTQQFAAEVLDQFGNPIIPSPGPAIGWTDLANTQLQNVCPPNYYQGQNYAFSYNCQNVINAWNSGIADTKRNRMIIWGGGHNNYYGNEVYSLNLAVSPPTLARLNDPSPIETDPATCPPALADGKANTRETFNGLVYLPNVDKMWVFNGGLACENGAHAQDTWTLDMATLQWTRMDPANGPTLPVNASGPTYQIAAWDPNTQTVMLNWSNTLWQYNYAANSYAVLNPSATVPVGTTGVIDPKRKLFIFIGSDAWVADSNAYVQAIDISPGSTYQVQDWSSQVTGCFPLANAVAPGLAYDPVLDRIVGWPGTGNTIYLFDPDTKTCTAQTYPNGPQNPTNNNGIYGRFQYFPALNAFAVVDQANLDASLLRIDPATTTGPSWQVSGGGSISASGLFTAGSAAGGPYSVTARSGSASGAGTVTVVSPPSTLSSTFLLRGNSTEVGGVANGSAITPTKAPSGFIGTVINTGGTVNFTPSQGADGVYFLNCCSNFNNAYFKFTGAAVGSVFNAREGQVSFNLQSRYSFAQRTASAATPRYAFDVRDGSGTHQFGFITQISGSLLSFTYLAGGTSGTYFVPTGTEDALFGSGVAMQVTIAWSPAGIGLFLNGTLVNSSAYAASSPNWSSASNFDVGAYEYLSAGGYDVSDDVIDEFTVSAPTASVPPAVSMSTPLDESVVSGITSVSANATDFVNITSVQFLIDGANLGAGVAGAGSVYNLSWNTANVGNGFHTLTAVATDASGNTSTANAVSVLVANAGSQPITASITAPANGATLTGTATVSVNASATAGIAGVQFTLDGANLGGVVTGAGPSYSYSWNTATAAAGAHVLGAVVTDNKGNILTVSSISITVANSSGPVISSVSAATSTGGGAAGSGQTAGATITWTTSTPSDSQINYGTTSSYGSASPLDSTLVTSHSVSLSGLASSTTYHYQVLSRDSSGNLSASADFVFTTPAQTLLLLHSDATEVTGLTNGSIVTPTAGPSGFTGTVAANGAGSVNFMPGQTGNGVYFLNCCANSNNAYYKFTGASVGNIFNASQGQISFYLKSRYSFAQRLANAAAVRYAFDVRDGNGSHLFSFNTQATYGYLEFSYMAGGVGAYYAAPAGTEDALFGNGVILQVTISWGASGANLYLNNTLVKSVAYSAPAPNWSAASNFDLGAFEYLTFGGYDVSDDVIDEFTVATGPSSSSSATGPVVSLTTPANGAVVAGTLAVTANATDTVALTGVQFQLDGDNLGGVVTGAGPTYTYTWNTTSVSSGPHTVAAIATDTGGNTAANSISLVVDNTPPTVSITSPAAGAALAGAVAITANAADNVAMASVQFQLDGANLGSAVTGAGPAYTYGWNTTSVSSGPHTITAIATDTGGNTATTNVSIVVNNTPPTVSISSPAAGAALTGTVTITANAVDNVGMAGVQFQLDGVNLGSAVTGAGPAYTYSWNTTSAGNGSHTISAIAADTAGNTATTSVSVTISHTPPTVSVTAPSAGAVLSNTVTLTANATDNVAVAGVQFQLDGVNLGSAVTGAGPTYSYSWNTAPAGNGTHTITAIATDTPGNTASASVSITIDHTPPTVSVTTPLAGAALSNTVNLTANATDNVAVAGVQFQLDGVNLGSAVTGAGPAYSYSWNTTSTGNGSHTISAVATDTAGNTATTSVSITISHTPPAVSVTAPSSGAVLSNTVTLTANATDNVAIAGVQFQLDGVNLGSAVTGAGPTYSYSWNTAPAGNGTHTITAIATDTPGNTASANVSITIDHTPPTISMAAPSAGVAVNGTVTITATATDTVAITGVQFQLDGVNLGSAVTGAGPTYSYSWNTASAGNGTHTITAIATDAPGNTASSSVSIVVDHTPPTVSITAPAAGAALSGTLSISASATDNVAVASVQLQLDGANLGAPLTGSGPTYTYLWNTTSVTTGTHTIAAIAADTAGNTASSSVSIIVDHIPPTVSVTAPAAGATVTGTVTVTGAASDNVAVASVQFQLDGVSLGNPIAAPGPYSLPWNTAAVSNGSHTLTAIATDTANNTTTSGAIAVTVVNPLLLLHSDASEVNGVSNGSIVTPTVAPAGFTGTVAANGSGSVKFTPAEVGNGVYFMNCCANTNNAYYKFTGAAVGSIFNVSQGQISFYLKSRYSYAQRVANAASPRYAFDVRDGGGNHLFAFITQATYGYLEFSYMAGGSGAYYAVPAGTEDTLFGNGVVLQVTISWGASGVNLYLNNSLVKSVPYTVPAPNWTSASNFDLGAYEYLTFGGYYVSDDVIDEFSVSGPSAGSGTSSLSVSLTSPANNATVSGTATVSANASGPLALSAVGFTLDGATLANVSGTGPSYVYSWNTTGVANGTHTLAASVTDSSGNTATSGGATVMVSNATGPVITGVTATSIASSGATINWNTSTPSNSQVNYGLTSSYGTASALASSLVTAHSIVLSGLSASTTYHYQVLSQDASGNLSSSADFTFSTLAPQTGPQPSLLLHLDATEVSGVTNASTITPSVGPAGFSGSVVANGTGSVNFAPAQVGNGVYFLNCCANSNEAYYKFTGTNLGNIFSATQGEITFYLKSRYSFAQRLANASAPRYAFDVRDGNGTHLFLFLTQVVSGQLVFTYMAGGSGSYYYVPVGTENTLFGNGVVLQVNISWSSAGVNLYLNNTLVKSVPYAVPAPNWTAASIFDLGAYEYFTFGGYNISDDAIDEFTVWPSIGH
jgi:hypothetical protein